MQTRSVEKRSHSLLVCFLAKHHLPRSLAMPGVCLSQSCKQTAAAQRCHVPCASQCTATSAACLTFHTNPNPSQSERFALTCSLSGLKNLGNSLSPFPAPREGAKLITSGAFGEPAEPALSRQLAAISCVAGVVLQHWPSVATGCTSVTTTRSVRHSCHQWCTRVHTSVPLTCAEEPEPACKL